MAVVDATRPAWATDFTPSVPRKLDSSRSSISYDLISRVPVSESLCAKMTQEIQDFGSAGLPLACWIIPGDWRLVGITSHKRSRWRWWLGIREWVVTFHFQAAGVAPGYKE